MKLNKSRLIDKLAEEIDAFSEEKSQKERITIARETVTLFFDVIKDSLISGDRVEIRGFGSFSVKTYDGYTGRNPKTGEKVQVRPKKLASFRPGRELKRIVDQ
jgi:integration host factor subunit beta